MYPDDPRPGRSREQRTLGQQILLVLIAVGVAIAVTAFAGVFLYLARAMR